MLGRFVCVLVRVVTAAPLPGVSLPRLGSREAVGRGGDAAEAARPGANHRARRAIPARNRTSNGFEAVGTKNDPISCRLPMQSLTHANATLSRRRTAPTGERSTREELPIWRSHARGAPPIGDGRNYRRAPPRIPCGQRDIDEVGSFLGPCSRPLSSTALRCKEKAGVRRRRPSGLLA